MTERNTSDGWLTGLKADLVGKNAHRTWIALITAAVTAYFAVYALFESRHDRQMQIALYERNAFITMVSSGNRGAFVAAMHNFAQIQNMKIQKYPSLFEPWGWFGDETPNRKPLWKWARYRLPICTPAECGDIEQDIRIDLRKVNWLGVHLPYVNFTGADFTGANLSSANFSDAILCKANLTNVLFSYADLTNADIFETNFTNASTRNIILAHVNVSSSNLSAEQLRRARGLSTDESGFRDGKSQNECRQ